MNHKRRRPKNRRAGCLMCKPHKMNGARKSGMDWTTRQQKQADASAKEQGA